MDISTRATAISTGRSLIAVSAILSAGFITACSGDRSPTDPGGREADNLDDDVSASASSSLGRPGTVADVSAVGSGDHSITLQWSEVDDGNGGAADYQIRFAPTPIDYGWGSATVATDGTCGSPVEGREVGSTLTCTVDGLRADASHDFQLVAFRRAEDGSRVYSEELSNVATATTTPEAPATVGDLAVADVGSSSATLEWTAVADGAGGAAAYEVRRAPSPMGYGWGDATVVVDGGCASPIEGREAGSTVTCTVDGLRADASHDFQLVAFRRAEDGSRVYSEELSNVATATTTSGAPAPVTDLSVKGTGSTSVTLDWTDVDDGAGAPASYQIRYAPTPLGYGWGGATVVRSGECSSPVRGSRIGSGLSCTVTGLEGGTRYDFQLVSFRDEGEGTRVYAEELSNIATGVTSDGLVDDGTLESDGTDDAASGGDSVEPTGFSRLVETTYAAASEGGFASSNNENFSIVSDPDAPRSPNTVARATFPAGLGDGRSPIWSEASISGHSVRRLYLSFWVKVSENWQGHQSGVNKVAIVWTHQRPVFVANIHGAGSGRLNSEMRLQDTPDGARNLVANRSDPEIVRGEWHRWEVVLVSNTGHTADGEVHWWIDGERAGEYRNVRFGTSSQSKIWDYATWRPVWGGRGDVIEETQHMWMDHYYVSGAP